MSETSDEESENKKAEQQSQSSSDQTNSSESAQPKPATTRPRIGTPIGTPIGQNPPASAPTPQPVASQPSTPQPATPRSQTQPPPAQRPTIGTPVGGRPKIGTPVGQTPTATSTTSTETKPPTAPAPAAQRPSIGTPVSGRPAIGTPSSGARPSVGTPTSGSNIAIPGSPSVPPKPKVESKKDISRRNFLSAMVIVGGALAIGGAGWFAPFIESSVGKVTAADQVLLLANGNHMLTSDVVTSDGPAGGALSDLDAVNGGAWQTFTYPYTGNPNIDSDTFKQCVIIRLPTSLTAPDLGFPYAVKDPLMSTYTISGLGDTLVAFSRVCVHLWCLWSYNPTLSSVENEYTRRMQCPCHGSNYVPGTGNYSPPQYSPGFPSATNQPPGLAVAGPASLQVAPNNQLPLIQLSVDPDGTLHATGIIGQIGCGQKC